MGGCLWLGGRCVRLLGGERAVCVRCSTGGGGGGCQAGERRRGGGGGTDARQRLATWTYRAYRQSCMVAAGVAARQVLKMQLH
jgi:hypothetical protein